MTIGEGIVVNGRYRLGPVIGRGGMFEVHDGYDLPLERPVAVKLHSTGHVDDPRLGRQFEAAADAIVRAQPVPLRSWLPELDHDLLGTVT